MQHLVWFNCSWGFMQISAHIQAQFSHRTRPRWSTILLLSSARKKTNGNNYMHVAAGAKNIEKKRLAWLENFSKSIKNSWFLDVQRWYCNELDLIIPKYSKFFQKKSRYFQNIPNFSKKFQKSQKYSKIFRSFSNFPNFTKKIQISPKFLRHF